MSYNKALAEKQWRAWKEAEERKLQELGVDENIIQRLRTYDWEEFKRERRYREWIDKGMPGMKPLIPKSDVELPVNDAESLLNDIDNPELFSILKNVDKKTLEILLMKLCGYSSEKISQKTGLTVSSINYRMWYLREKIKNFFHT